MKCFFLLLVIVLLSLEIHSQTIQPKPVVVCGKVLNYNEFRDLETIRLKYSSNVHMLNAFSEVSIIDSEGFFKFSFIRNMPQDVLINFLTTFDVFVSPGDSIYFEFEASRNRVHVFETIKFYGDGVHNNSVIANFNKLYFNNRPSVDVIKTQQKKLSPQKYTSFLDSIRSSFIRDSEELLSEKHVSDTAKAWIDAKIQMDYLINLAEYPEKHREYNSLKKGEWFVEDDFFNPIIHLDFNELMLCNSDFAGVFVNRYHHQCISYLNQKHLFLKGKGEYKKEGRYDVFIHRNTSITFGFGSGYKQAEKEIKPILKYTKDNIIRQLIIREYYSQNIDNKGFDLFFNENRRKVFDKYVTSPLIRQQFFDYYTPSPNTLSIKTSEKGFITNESFAKIINDHKGKVIYIDCWGTWCAPCLSDLPHFNHLIERYKSEDIVFIFICIDSPKDQWDKTIKARNLKGEHHWFDKDKSNKLRADYDISGIPFYFLINEEGKIYSKGNNLKPSQSETIEQIEKLLKK